MALEILCVCVAILLLLYYYATADFDYWKSRGVKGPKPIPWFGTIASHLLSKICMGSYLRKIYEEYPDEAMVGVFFRGQPKLVIRDPELIKHVLIKDFTAFPERDVRVHEKAEPLSVHLFRIDGARWRPLRTRLSPVFTSGKLKDMFHLLLECGEHLERHLHEIVPKDDIIECRELTSKYTIDVIGSCAFGIEMNALNQKESDFQKLGVRIFKVTPKTLIRNLFRDVTPWLYDQFGNILDDREVTNIMTTMVMNTINYRKQNNVHRQDIIDMLKDFKDHPDRLDLDQVPDTYVAAQLFVFFAAGYETSSTTMSNVMYELAQNLVVQEKVRNNIKEVLDNNDGVISYNSVNEMTYLEQVIKETLRKYPPVMFLTRNTQQNYTFEGTKVNIDKDVKVYIPIFGIHYDPNIYPNPDVFDPERFNDENMRKRNPMHYLPFGTGPRNCIGMRFAGYQTKVGLIKVLLNFEINVCEKTQIPHIISRNHPLMFQTEHGIYVKLTKLF
ncbi:PREDICTED: cytochrome P450 6j1-like [Dinoponera quadriceps]|uniref:Cytochrome P450 6j1-like n=1 Tax=Dinoponera quadriceps TaxID=609295 RepID=A0A6P3XBD9_DINQU|nr:PREDICTED: cytochrome P450 6j1-like [Dinoponera quadriceps]XP_014475209.1 PREDICTED: cytochrome P450 6j1-like [Dinoponera quadriceps]XP_014475210.1 PREDICTED: cytochrome P450 6j1-like [Dinoponera quadriceps]